MKLSLLTLIKESKKYLILVIPLILFSSFFGVYPMKLIQQIVDVAVLKDSSKIYLIIRYGFFYIASFLFWSASLYLQNILVRKAEVEKGHEIRSKLFNHIMFIPQYFFTDNKSGDIAADLLKDSEITTTEFLKPVVYITNNIVKFTMGLVLMLSIDWRMTLFVFPLGLFSSILVRKTRGKMKNLTENQRNKTTQMWGFFSEVIRGIKEIKANNR